MQEAGSTLNLIAGDEQALPIAAELDVGQHRLQVPRKGLGIGRDGRAQRGTALARPPERRGVGGQALLLPGGEAGAVDYARAIADGAVLANAPVTITDSAGHSVVSASTATSGTR